MPVSIPNPRAQKRARIEIIPLIDIIFFLLATFVMVSMSMVKNEGISIRLPIAASGQAIDRSKSLVITVNQNGDYYLNKEKLYLEELINKLSVLKKKDPELKLLLNGDAKVYFESIIKVLDATRKIGLTQIAIQTTKQ